MEITVTQLLHPVLKNNVDSNWKSESYDVSIGQNQILTIYTETEFTISKWIGEIQKIHRSKNKKHRTPLVIGFSADRELLSKKGGVEDNPYQILTLCVGGSHCLIISMYALVGCSIHYWQRGYRNSYDFPKPLKDLLTDSNTIIVGLDIEQVSKKLEKDYGLMLGKTVDLQSLAEKGTKIITIVPEGEIVEEEKERDNIVRRGPKLDDLLNRAMEPEMINVRRPTRKIHIGGTTSAIDPERVKYSTLDAFVAWKIGNKYMDLIKSNLNTTPMSMYKDFEICNL